MTNPCSCGAVDLHTALSMYTADGVHHWPADLICFETDDLWAIA